MSAGDCLCKNRHITILTPHLLGRRVMTTHAPECRNADRCSLLKGIWCHPSRPHVNNTEGIDLASRSSRDRILLAKVSHHQAAMGGGLRTEGTTASILECASRQTTTCTCILSASFQLFDPYHKTSRLAQDLRAVPLAANRHRIHTE